MKKTIVFTLLLSLFWNLGFSQSEVDRLKHELAITTTDTTRAGIMSTICNSLSGTNPDSALYYGEKALALSRKIKFPKGEILALSFTSGVLNSTGNLPKALSMAFEALQIAEKNHLDAEKKWPSIYISVVYVSLGDFRKAIKFRKKALRIAEASDDTYSKSIENGHMGSLYLEIKQLDSASFFFNRSLFFSDGSVPFSTFRGLGDIQAQKGDYVRAMEYYQKSLKQATYRNSHRNIASSYLCIAKLYKNKNQRDSSIYYAKKALTESQPILFKKAIIEAGTLLSELYEPINNKASYDYYKLATVTKDSLFGPGNIQSLQVLIAQEEDRQNEVQRAKAAFQNQLKQYALFMGLAVFLLIAFILYRNNKNQKEANTLLQEQKEKVESTLSKLQSTQAQLIQSEKLASLGELTAGIAHEIQNPLNFVNNFAEVSAEMLVEMDAELDKGDVQEAKAISADLQQNLQKINHHGQRASAIVKGMLEHSRASTGVKEPTDLNALADEYLRLSYHGQQAKDANFNANLITDFDPAIGLVEVIPQDIGRVFLNLINNAFYAVTEKAKQGEGYQPTVTIRTKKLENAIEVRVQDNGNGIPEAIKEKIFQPFFTTKPTGQGTGLGLSLAYDIVTKGHGGSLEVQSTEGFGSEFIIQLPSKNEA